MNTEKTVKGSGKMREFDGKNEIDSVVVNRFYNTEGTEDVENNSCARMSYNTKTDSYKYFAKLCGGILYDPISPLKQVYKMTSVKEEAFRAYVHYLRTKNIINLRKAERML